MKRNRIGTYIIIVIILVLTVGLMGCSKLTAPKVEVEKKIDVILWNSNGDRFPAASGLDLMKYAAVLFEVETDVNVNLISIEASNQEDYFNKRAELLLSKDKPEMILFNTRYQDELLVMESMKHEMLPLNEFVPNTLDILAGLRGEHYSAISVLVYGNIMNNEMVRSFGHDSKDLFMSSEVVEELYMKWAETEPAVLNLYDFNIFSGLGLSRMMQIEDNQVRLDYDLILDKIIRNKAFVASLPNRDLSLEDVMAFRSGSDKNLIGREREAFLATAHLRPVNFLTSDSFNAFDLSEFYENVNSVSSGFAMGDYSQVMTIGFGVLDNQSEAQDHAISFAKFLLSPEFQRVMQSYSSQSPKMTGSVLKSVNEEQRSVVLSTNQNEGLSDVIVAHNMMIEHLDTPGAIRFSAQSNISREAFDEITRIAMAHIWGETKTDSEILEALNKLEEKLNLMIRR